MKKHIEMRIKLARLISETSPCPRARVGAVLFAPDTWEVIADGYNGPPRGGGELCGGDVCAREGVVSGTRCEVGCAHAEFNAIANAARRGASTLGAWCAVTIPPCLMCAKLMHHAGITKVFIASDGVYSDEGSKYLNEHNIEVCYVNI